MTKISKSARIERDINCLVDEYIDFLKRVMGVSLNFSEIVNLALAMYLSKMSDEYSACMHAGSIVTLTSKGDLRKLTFTEEELKEVANLRSKALSLENRMTEDWNQ